MRLRYLSALFPCSCWIRSWSAIFTEFKKTSFENDLFALRHVGFSSCFRRFDCCWRLSDVTASLVPLSLKVIQICICIWLVFVFQHLIVWRSGWLFGQTCFNWNLKWVCWYRRGAFSQLLHPALRTLQWLRYLDENAKIRPHLNTSKNTLLESQ